MDTKLCRTLGIEFPLLAFSHCRDVAASVGGFGVFGAAGTTPERLETELAWIDANVDGQPCGVDLLVPENLSIRTETGATQGDLAAQIPAAHRTFVLDLLRRHDVDPTQGTYAREDPDRPPPYQFETGEKLMELAFCHPIRLIANALGVPPASMLERARQNGIPVPRWSAPANTPSVRSPPGSISSSRKAAKPAATAARSLPLSWSPKSCAPPKARSPSSLREAS